MQENGPGGRSAAPESDWRLVLVATLAVFAVYAISTWSRTLPMISWDELGFIVQAQRLAGVPVTVNMGTAPYYHAGYSLLLVPVLWLTQDPLLAYKGFLLVNAVLAALLVPLLVSIGEAFGFRRSPAMLLAAVIVSLWPSHFFVSYYAWSEALFRLVFVANVWALTRLTLRPGAWWAILFSASAAGLYAVHPKALLILLLAPAVLVLLRMIRVLDTRSVLAALVLFVALTAAEMLAMGYLHATLWDEDAYSAGDTLAGRLLRPEALFTGLVVVMGQLWYQLAASLGLAGLGLWLLVRRTLPPGAAVSRLIAGYATAAVLAVAAASVVQMLDPVRVDHIAYGRYIDGASVLPLWLGLCWLVFGERGEGQRAAGLIAVAIVVVAGGVLASLPLMSGLDPAHPEAVAGLGWIFRGGSSPLQFFGINALLLAAVTIGVLLANRIGQMATLITFVVISGAMIYGHLSAQARAQLAYLSSDADIVRTAKVTPLYWTDDVRDGSPWSYHLQYTLAAPFLNADGWLPAGAGLISTESGWDGLVCVARLTNGLFLLARAPHPAAC